MQKYPLLLSYVAKERLWGGSCLKEQYGKEADTDALGETWELTVRQDEMSRVLNGPFTGMPLDAVIAAWGQDCVAPNYDGAHFPLLVKLIDAKEPLSVQVHPDDAYASRVEHDAGKTEMWYILSAAPGASIVYGLRPGIDRATYAASVHAGDMEGPLYYRPVQAGDVCFIPSGLVHAIGGGITLAEIQQNSDLTYRVYDYGRRGADGKCRPLHTEKALDVVRPFSDAEIDAIRFEARTAQDGDDVLAHCRYFSTRLLRPQGNCTFSPEHTFASLLITEGEGTLCHAGQTYPLRKGQSWFLPAGMGACAISGPLSALLTTL